MPAKTEKQKRFFGAVMGAKKGQKGVKGAAKKASKEMSKKEVKKFLKVKGESFDIAVNDFLKNLYFS
jgi:hypothetical protein